MGVPKKKVLSVVLTMVMVAPMVLGIPLTAKAAGTVEVDYLPGSGSKYVTDVYANGNDVFVDEDKTRPGYTVIKVAGKQYYAPSADPGAVHIYLGARAGKTYSYDNVSITVKGGYVKQIILSGQGSAGGSKADSKAMVTNARVTVRGGKVDGIKTQTQTGDVHASTVAEMNLLGGMSYVNEFSGASGRLKPATKCKVVYYRDTVSQDLSSFPKGSGSIYADQVMFQLAKFIVRPGEKGKFGTSKNAIVTDIVVKVNGYYKITLEEQMPLGYTSRSIFKTPTSSEKGKVFKEYRFVSQDGELGKQDIDIVKLTGPKSYKYERVPVTYKPGMSNDPLNAEKTAWKDLDVSATSDPYKYLENSSCVIIEATYEDYAGAPIGDTYKGAAFSRLAGSDRVQTSVAVANKMREMNGGPFENVILACANNFPDALSASTLSAVVAKNDGPTNAAPIILVNSANEMNVALAVKDLWKPDGKGKIYLIGGEAALPNSVVDALNKVIKDTVTGGLYDKDTNEDGKIKRLAGPDRYATNVAVLEEAKALTKTGGTYVDSTFFNSIILASGENYPDALAASAGFFPIALTRETAVPEGTVEFIQSVNCDGAMIVGGTSVVGTAVETWTMNEFGRPAVHRVAGVDRFETAAKIADNMAKKEAILAYGFDYPDALAAGPLAQMTGASILLVTDQNKDAAVSVGNEYKVEKGFVLGGPTLISGTTAAEIIKDR